VLARTAVAEVVASIGKGSDSISLPLNFDKGALWKKNTYQPKIK
jgi:hypothetical protein